MTMHQRTSPSPTRLLGISGSIRSGSNCTAVLRSLQALLPGSASIELFALDEIPLYNADLDGATPPAAVAGLKEAISQADGLVVCSPEYNYGMPGVLKNAIDWLSRPPADIPRVFRGLPLGFIGATPGMGGTLLSQAAWLPVFRILGVLPFFEGRVIVAGAGKVFDETGSVVDSGTSARVREYTESFAAFVGQRKRPRP
jgi:chromate reductase